LDNRHINETQVKNQRLKIAFAISNISKVLLFEWLSEKLNKEFEPVFIIYSTGNTEIEAFLKANNKTVYHINYSSVKNLPFSLFQTLRIFRKEKIKIVHAHLFEASLISLTAAKMLGIKKRIHTRHHSTFHHDYFPKAVKYDKFINYISTDIIAISTKVKKLLVEKENVSPNKVYLIYHGFDLSIFSIVKDEQIDALKLKYKLTNHFPIIGVVSRYTNWKGIEYIIKAVENLLSNYPNAKLVLANAKGNDKKEIQTHLKSLPINNYVEIEYERDMPALYKCMNVFVHVPIDNEAEAFGQVYVEAMAANVPCVVTLSGIANEYVVNNFNAAVVNYKDAIAIEQQLKRIIENNDFANSLTQNALKDVNCRFDFEIMMNQLEKIYKQ
jgi:glycosyltransferase involved in cell wall biosynthesis